MPLENEENKETPQQKDTVTEKLGQVESHVRSLAETNRLLAQQLEALKRPAPVSAAPVEKRPVSDRLIDEPEAVLRELKDEATREALERFNSVQQREAEKNAALQTLVNDYPELHSETDPLRVKSVEIHNQLPDYLKNTAAGMKIAIREAAADLGVLPKGKRKAEPVTNDDETYQTGGTTTKGRTPRKEKELELAEETLLFAEALGRPVDDEKYMERLKKANQRTVWNKYRPA